MPLLSAIICTYSPRADYLSRVVEAYAGQTLDSGLRELVIVDSASPQPISARSDLRLPDWVRVVRAPEPGLALARLIGAREAKGEFIASLDDDTVMDPGYLETGLAHLQSNPRCASVSGRLRGEFETSPPDWITEFHSLLALRDLGDAILTASGGTVKEYPACAPLGVNITRRKFCLAYHETWAGDALRQTLGRKAGSLASGEDNDFALFILRRGGDVAYLPGLRLIHLIPSTRLSPAYLARLNEASQKTWCRVLLLNQISPWPPIHPWTLPLRIAKAWLHYRPWSGPRAYIRWRGACVHFEGRARLHSK